MTPPSSPDDAPSAGEARRQRRDRMHRRAVQVALAVSAAIHLMALALYPGLRDRDRTTPRPFVPLQATTAQGMTAIQLVEVTTDDPEAPPEPDEVEEVAPPDEAPEGPDLDEEAEQGGLVAPGPTVAEEMRPDLRDARLWAPVDPALTELTLEQRLELEMAGMLEAWRDSVVAAEAAERALTDWTFTDDDGGRWGVSPGEIHLGDFSLPLPFGFGVNPGRREEAAYRAWEWEELQRGQITGEVRDSWKARAEAIRARRDRARAESRPDSAGGG